MTLPSNPGSNHDSFHPVWYKPSISLATITAIASWSPCFHPSALHLFSQDSWSDSLKKEVQKKKGSSSPPVAPISFRVKVTGPLFLMSDSHVYSISTTLASLLFLKHSRRARCLYLRALPMTFSLCLDCPLPPDIYMTDSLFPSSVCSKVTSVKPTDYPCLKLQPPIPLSCFPPPQSFLSNDFYYIFYAHLLPLNCKLCEFLLIKYLNHLIN